MSVVQNVSALLFPVRRGGKRLICALILSATAFGLPGHAQTSHRVVIPQAHQVDLSHLGVHTHANFLLFDTGPLDVSAMLRDKARYPHLILTGHSRLETDHAALPPEMQAFATGSAPLDNPYGPIDGQKQGKPGWGAIPEANSRRHLVKILIPTRFANWVALQSKIFQKKYRNRRNYSLEIRWG